MSTVTKSSVYTSSVTAGSNTTGALVGVLTALAAPVVTYVSGTILVPYNTPAFNDSAQVQIGLTTSVNGVGTVTVSAAWRNVGTHFDVQLIEGLGAGTNTIASLLGGPGILTVQSQISVIENLTAFYLWNATLATPAGIMTVLNNYVLPPGYTIYTLGDASFPALHKLTSIGISQA